MSTITKELAKLFRKITNSEIDAEGNAHVVLSPADSLLINNARIALASLEAEAVCVIDQSNLDYLKSGSDADVWPASRAEMGDVLLYRSATPAPVSVPAAMEMDDDFDSAFEHGKAVGWNACRAAMLQSFGNSEQLNSPVIPDGWKLVPIDPTKDMLRAGQSVVGFWLNTVHCYSKMLAAAPAAPKQEVKLALEHGMQRYAVAMQKLSEGDK